MCGIVGYVGPRLAADFLLEGLRRLEYRGYDSAGIATTNDGNQLKVCKTVGRIDSLASLLNQEPLAGNVGIGHTRWATHGPANRENAHPHLGGNSMLAIAHNGVIDNFQPIKARLESEGYVFRSATDSEVIAQLIHANLERATKASSNDPSHNPLVAAVRTALKQLRGTFGLVVLFREYPDLIVAARFGSPLVVGVSEGEHFVASDASPLAGYADKIIYLADHQIATITADSVQVSHRDQGYIKHTVQELQVEAADVTTDGYEHFMQKEIFEQPETVRNAMRGRLNDEDATAVFGGLNLTAQQLRSANRILLTACGTSWHAALLGEYLIEAMARIPVEVEYASELRYRNPPAEPDTLLFAITQSGETADTLAAMREMKRKGHHTLSICNVVGSSIAQDSAGGVFLHAGPEIGVASTKPYTSQCVVLTLLALYFGRLRHLSYEAGERIIASLRELPGNIEGALATDRSVLAIAEKYQAANNFLYLGRQYNFPTALEGALKLKEISYIHAEGYPAAEMKHGPIALVDERTPSVFIIPQGGVYEKVIANMEEVKARGGPVIAVVEEGDQYASALADDVIVVPRVDEVFQPIVSIVPLQLLAYHIAVLRGCDVDKPRNLAKSVTVE